MVPLRAPLPRWRLAFALLTAVALGATAVPLLSVGARAAPVTTVTRQAFEASNDFNGDGYPDLAIGAPGADGSRGTVTVVYGSPSGLSAIGSQSWDLSSAGVGLPPRVGDQFGYAVTTGHFRGGPYADLAVGVPGRSGVVVLEGSRHGLRAAGSQFVRSRGPFGGFSLAAADFNGDGFTDLALGEPFANVGVGAAGRVEVEYGGPAGLGTLTSPSTQEFSAATPGMPGSGPANDATFGFALSAGDFNSDGFADLSIGAPGDNNGRGDTIALYGSSSGLTLHGAQLIPAWGASGGYALATGDFNGDGYSDLAIGEPDGFTSIGSGMVEVYYGSPLGLTRTRLGAPQLFSQGTIGMPGPRLTEYDRFGFSLASADFNGDGRADLAVGVPGLSAVDVLYGSDRRLTVRRAQYVPGIGPHVGSLTSPSAVSIAGGDFRGSGYTDLVVGEPYTPTSQQAGGVIEVHPGSAGGVTLLQQGTGQLLSGDTSGMAGGPSSAGETLGWSLAG